MPTAADYPSSYGVPENDIDTKGAIPVTRNPGDIRAIVPTGNNGYVLTEDSTSPNGWSSQAGGGGGGGITPSFVNAGNGSNQTSTDIMDTGYIFLVGSDDLTVNFTDTNTSITFDADTSKVMFAAPGTYFLQGIVRVSSTVDSDTGDAVAFLSGNDGGITLPEGTPSLRCTITPEVGGGGQLIPLGGLMQVQSPNTGTQIQLQWSGDNDVVTSLQELDIFRIA